MRRFSQFVVPFAAVPILLSSAACSKEEAKPPPPGAKLCGVTIASWWFDATGADDLSGPLIGGLPLRNPAQTKYSTESATCEVFSDGKRVGRFRAEVTTADEVLNAAAQVDRRPADRRFTAAGGKGMVDPNSHDDGASVWWTCKSALLNVEVLRPKDVKKRIELTKTLGKRVAAVVGCPGPVPVLPEQ